MMTMSQAALILNGSLTGGDSVFENVSNDTRKLGTGSLYVALKGERFDGHDFIADAEKAGAVGAIVSEKIKSKISQIRVEDTRKALADLAADWRQQFKGPVIAITGSNGKTTVKEMTAAVLSMKGKVLATQGNYNNDIGLPLTLLRLAKNDDFAVIEMGANHHGEIELLSSITQPDIALITNAGSAHLEGFGSLQGVAEAKGEIFQSLSATTGVAIINSDDKYSDYWASLCAGKRITRFGLEDENADIKGDWQATETGGQLKISMSEYECTVNLMVPGRHNAMNALAAAAIGLSAGVSLQDIASALGKFKAVKGRLNIIACKDGMTIIDDTYNANPASVDAGMDVLMSLPGKHCLILGDMGELGVDSKKIHQQVGKSAKDKKLDCLLAVGQNSKAAVDAFGDNALHFANKEALLGHLTSKNNNNLKILVKGSRSMKMETIVNAFLEEVK